MRSNGVLTKEGSVNEVLVYEGLVDGILMNGISTRWVLSS